MNLIKRLLPLRETIQTFKVDTQGFRITINENPPTLKFGVFLKITYFGRGDRKKEREKEENERRDDHLQL